MADQIRATPRNSLAALLSDAINSGVGYMKDPRRTQQLQGLGRLIESTGIPYTAESLSYDPSGRGLFTGAGGLGGTTRMRPEALEAAMTVAPFVAPANRALMQATKGLPVGASIKSLDDIFKKYPDLTIDASVGKKDINLSRIEVPKEMRNQGVGTQVMSDLSEYADSIGKRITLTPSGDFGGSVPKLKAFYKELGFVENKGKNKDFSTRETMYREPQSVEQSAKAEYPLAPAGTRYEEFGGQLTYMTPDEYLSRVRPLELDDVSLENIASLKSHVQSGGKLDPLHIYKDGKEDGRHRAYMAKELGIKKIPVALHTEENNLGKNIAVNPMYQDPFPDTTR
jgi:GNAT superfamily N-acetyltransferase